jgi:hypothetical protein
MKKLNKLSISPQKIMKNEDLINLQGGYQGWCCFCGWGYGFMGGSANDNPADCQRDCGLAFGQTDWYYDVSCL